MIRIRQDQYEVAYKVGLRWYRSGSRGGGTMRLLEESGMGMTSGEMLAGNVGYMLRGEVYKRTMSIETTGDFLAWLHRDQGDEGLRSALKALAAHIEYYESNHIGQRKGLRDILAIYEAVLNAPKEAAIRLEYDAIKSRGFVDILPLALFAEEGTTEAIIHMVHHHRSGQVYQAQCDVTVRAQETELNYLPYKAFNSKNGMLLGVARLIFEDTDRTAIVSLEWKPMVKEDFKRCAFKTPTFLLPPGQPYEPPSEAAVKSLRRVRDRPGQAVFRRNLKAVYNNCCCISGCPVPEVLEGAHIDGYMTRASDNIRNGLLMRSDLHALFDSGLISINPQNFEIHVAEGASVEAGYAYLEGMLLQLPSDPTHHPDQSALQRHWKRFQQR